jgi:hypothetical protein
VLDGADASESLDAEDYFVFKLALLLEFVVVDHQLEVVVRAQLAARPLEILDLLHFPLKCYYNI